MTELRVYQIDAFTQARFHGNPAGVVTNAAGMSEQHMQLVARELNNSETAFVLPAQGDDHDIWVRFFSPTTEVPVCGHATVAAHFALALERGVPQHAVRQLTGAGVQAIRTLSRGDGYRIAIDQGRPSFTAALSQALVAEVADALGVDTAMLDPRCPVQFVSTGHGKLLVGLRDRHTLASLAPDAVKLTAVGPRVGTNGFFVFTLDTDPSDDGLTLGRMFAPAIGIAEDPVTGNANGPLGAYLVRHGLLRSDDADVVRFRARQRAGSGREGFMDVSVATSGDEPMAVTIEGDAVLCFETRLPREL